MNSGARPSGLDLPGSKEPGLSPRDKTVSTHIVSNPDEIVKPSDEDSSSGVKNQMSADKYSYDALVSKPDMKIIMVNERNIPEPSNLVRRGIINHALENAAKVGTRREDGNITVHVNDTDSDVILSRKGLIHGLDRRFSVNAPVTLQAGKILQNAIRINEMTPNGQQHLDRNGEKSEKRAIYRAICD